LIPPYYTITDNTYPIYTDPTRSIFDAFHLVKTLDRGNARPKYLKKSLPQLVVAGVSQGLSSGRYATKGGEMSQIGGEFLFALGEDATWKMEWAHRMRTTQDHAEVEVLGNVLGVKTINVEDDKPEKSWWDGLSDWRKAWK
jgi:AhpC/TSA antioxidant enzyme